jgi:hypothetical protein
VKDEVDARPRDGPEPTSRWGRLAAVEAPERRREKNMASRPVTLEEQLVATVKALAQSAHKADPTNDLAHQVPIHRIRTLLAGVAPNDLDAALLSAERARLIGLQEKTAHMTEDFGYLYTSGRRPICFAYLPEQPAAAGDAPGPETETCHFCHATMARPDAIANGWIPYFYKGDVEIDEAVCVACLADGRVFLGPEDEYEYVAPRAPGRTLAALDAADRGLLTRAASAVSYMSGDDVVDFLATVIVESVWGEPDHEYERWASAKRDVALPFYEALEATTRTLADETAPLREPDEPAVQYARPQRKSAGPRSKILIALTMAGDPNEAMRVVSKVVLDQGDLQDAIRSYPGESPVRVVSARVRPARAKASVQRGARPMTKEEALDRLLTTCHLDPTGYVAECLRDGDVAAFWEQWRQSPTAEEGTFLAICLFFAICGGAVVMTKDGD